MARTSWAISSAVVAGDRGRERGAERDLRRQSRRLAARARKAPSRVAPPRSRRRPSATPGCRGAQSGRCSTRTAGPRRWSSARPSPPASSALGAAGLALPAARRCPSRGTAAPHQPGRCRSARAGQHDGGGRPWNRTNRTTHGSSAFCRGNARTLDLPRHVGPGGLLARSTTATQRLVTGRGGRPRPRSRWADQGLRAPGTEVVALEAGCTPVPRPHRRSRDPAHRYRCAGRDVPPTAQPVPVALPSACATARTGPLATPWCWQLLVAAVRGVPWVVWMISSRRIRFSSPLSCAVSPASLRSLVERAMSQTASSSGDRRR